MSSELEVTTFVELVDTLRESLTGFFEQQVVRDSILLDAWREAGLATCLTRVDEFVTHFRKEGGDEYWEPIYRKLFVEFETRRLVGLQTYQHLLSDDPNSVVDWLNDALQEAMDQVVYLIAAREKIKTCQNQ